MAPRPPQPAEPPSLTRFGRREAIRGAEIWLVIGLFVARAAARHIAARPRDVLRLRRDAAARRALADAVATGLVEAFMTLGPTFVKLGQMIASSPGMFPAPLADACLRTLDDVPPFPAAEALAIVEEDLGASATELFAALLRDNGAATLVGEQSYGAGCGYTNGGVRLELESVRMTLRAPDCARLRASGENERAGIVPDLPLGWDREDPAGRARMALAAAAPGAQASRPIPPGP